MKQVEIRTKGHIDINIYPTFLEKIRLLFSKGCMITVDFSVDSPYGCKLNSEQKMMLL